MEAIEVLLKDGGGEPSERVPPNAAEPAARRADIPSLDGLRAISIILVLAGHAIPFWNRSFRFRALFLHADLGVRIFFIISGFLITGLLLKERSDFGGISLRLFYIRRALRILPAFYLFVGCVALLTVLGIVSVPGRNWLYVLTYTVNFDTQVTWAVGHLWSLSVEEQFYLLWPLAMRMAKPRAWVAIAILAIFAGIAVRAVFLASGLQLLDPRLRAAFPLVCGPIAMGCLLAIGHRWARRVIVSSKFLSGGAILLLTLPLIALLDALELGTTANTLLAVLTNSLLTFCVARLVFVPTDLAGRFLNSSPLVLIGKLSYSLYLWQQLFLNPSSNAILCRFPVNLVATLAAASASYWGLEVRFLGLRKKYRYRKLDACQPIGAVNHGR